MAEKQFGLEYEPRPAWTECKACGARRPPADLRDGKRDDWSTKRPGWMPEEWAFEVVNRCAELALSKERP